jgi:hypothetical protein
MINLWLKVNKSCITLLTMKNKLYTNSALIVVAFVLLGAIAAPAFALIKPITVVINASGSTSVAKGTSVAATANVSTTITVAVAARIKNLQTRADEEIARRITALNALNARVSEMQKVSSADKASLSATISSQITALNTLQTQIAADATANSTTSLVTDVKSITGSYRIFALVIPQGAIEAASDRILTVVDTMNTLSLAFSTRISAAASAGADVTAIQATFADFNVKVDDANTQAQAATTEVAALVPDGGVQAQMTANTAALKDARTKIQTSQQDLIAARTDAQTIIKDLMSFEASGHSGISASTTVSASASTTAQ